MALHGDRPAIAGTDWRPTFASLDRAANALATELLERAPGPGRAAILMRHDAPQVAAVLAAVKAGKPVATMNPSEPLLRLQQLRADLEPHLALVDESNRELALEAGFGPDELVVVADRPRAGSAVAPRVSTDPGDLAFVVYTSGSTGRPKGVMQTHGMVLHNTMRQSTGLGIGPGDRVAQTASLSGGQGITTLWMALATGAATCPFPVMDRGVTGLADWLSREGITAFISSTSVFRSFARTLRDERFPGVRAVRVGSELGVRTDFDAFRRHFDPDCLFVNTLSSAETGNITQWRANADARPEPGPLPVGEPAPGMEVLLLDEDGAEVADGAPGEIVVRSRYLSPGYWRDDELTAQRFRGTGAERRFHTRDLGRRGPGGAVTWLGRADAQVKVRGHRVELPELEAALAALPELEAAAVSPRRTERGDMRLIACVVPRPGAEPSGEELRRRLRTTLPAHAVPAGFVFVESLPLTPHGKVDSAQLAELEPAEAGKHSAPADDDERRLAELWAEALERQRVGRDQDFFALGGDSLTAAVIAAAVQDVFGVELQLRAFSDAPTVAEMGRLLERLDGTGSAARPPLVPRRAAGWAPMSFEQERVWRHSRTPKEAATWTMAPGLELRGPLDREELRRGIERVVERHEVLRATYGERAGEPVQIVGPPAPLELPFTDLRSADDPPAAADARLRDLARTAFDLEQGPLLQFELVRLADDHHRLLRANHHIQSDAASWPLFFREAGALYEGAPPPEPLPVQYGDYAAWQRAWLSPGTPWFERELDWWQEALRDCPPELPLPFARETPDPSARPVDGIDQWALPAQVASDLDQIGREIRATRFTVRLAAFAAELARTTRSDDFALGVYVSNRRTPELQRLVGLFSNLTTIRLRYDRSLTFREWVGYVAGVVLDAAAHGELPYSLLSEELGRRGTPPPAVRTIFHFFEGGEAMSFGGLGVKSFERPRPVMPWEFTLLSDPAPEDANSRVLFDAHKHDPAEVRSFMDGLVETAGALARGPDRRLRALDGGPLARARARLGRTHAG